MDKLLKALEAVNDLVTSVAKSLKDGDNDAAVEDLTKTSTLIADTVAEITKDADNADADDDTTVDADGGDDAADADDADDNAGDDIEKVTIEVSKVHAEAIQKMADAKPEVIAKWAELWVSESDVADLFNQLADIAERLARVEKSSDQLDEDDDSDDDNAQDVSKTSKSSFAGVFSQS